MNYKYEVRDVVCDYGVYENDKLCLICNSRKIAQMIVDLMRFDEAFHRELQRNVQRNVPESPFPDGDKSILACAHCNSGEYLHNEDGNRNNYCGQCGKAILWEDEKPWIYRDLDEAIDSD